MLVQIANGAQNLDLQRQNRVVLSVIFSAPGVKVRYVAIDWLHCVDLGVTQTILGNLSWESQKLLRGATQKARVSFVSENEAILREDQA